MTPGEFQALMKPVTDAVAGQTVDAALAGRLDELFPPDGETFRAIEKACHGGIAAGWMCAEGAEGQRYGRVIEPAGETGNLSVDVVDLTDFQGPHHSHPNGEICMIMPVTDKAQFDGKGAGWCVYPPGSAHQPTVSGGHALVLYMLPEGKMRFTR